MSVAQAASILGISSRMLRHYEAIGLIKALRKDNIRKFETTEILKLSTVIRLRQFGFTLEEIGILLAVEMKQTSDFHPSQIPPTKKMIITKVNEMIELGLKCKKFHDC